MDFDRIKLKTLKLDDDEISSIQSAENPNDQEMKTNLMKRATSITNKLTDTFNRLTTSNPTTTTTTNLMNNYSQDLTHLDQFQFPIQLFNKVCLHLFRKISQ